MPDLRVLARDASFGDLLDAARTLDDRRDQESDAGCLLRRAWRLEADLAVAVRPLPAAPEDLDERLRERPDPVNVLSRWGAYGTGDASRDTFVAVTTTMPPRTDPALIWVVTDLGVYVRMSGEPVVSPDPVTDPGALESLHQIADSGVLYVTAERAVPLERIAEVLEQVPEAMAGRVGLAVALAPGTRLPEPPAAPTGTDLHALVCPDGLPGLPDDAPLGRVRPDVFSRQLTPLREGVAACMSASHGPGAAGGRVLLALRVAPDGRVAEACFTEDDTGDPELLACVARAAGALAFSPAEPPGYVDIQLPLVLAPLDSQRQRPLCR